VGWFARAVITCLSLTLGLVMVEGLAAVARDHAFPFLNIYEADPTFGVRLSPSTTTATRSREGRVTDVRTNALGFRGAEWTPAESSAPVAGRVMLLGDSQVFGYGVDEPDALAVRLQSQLGEGYEVLNAGVPTWGPQEQVQALDVFGPTYRPEVVVYFANVANDWFEAKRPNVERTTARDGWAAFVLQGQPEVIDFPGRGWLMGRSHVVFGVRELLAHASGPPPQKAVSADRLLSDLPHLTRPDGRYRSRLTPPLMAVRARCRALGCRVVAVGLPMDVQVHTSEWKKYASERVDLRATEVLLDLFLGEARHHGVRAVDLRGPLLAASPGAFLPDDYHLSAQGHDAIARALAPVVSAPARNAGAAQLAHQEVRP
jgi:hypothetical protein